MMSAAAAVLAALAVALAQIFHGGLLRPALAVPALAVAAGAGTLGALEAFRRGGLPAPRLLPVWLAAALAAWLLFRCAQAPDTPEAAGMARLILACAALFFAFAAGITDPRHRLAFLGCLGALALAQASFGAWQFIRREGDLPLGWFSEQLRIYYEGRLDGWRAHGFYINGNHLAWFLNASALAMLAVAAWSRAKAWLRVLALYAFAMALAGSLITLSRGGIIGLATGLSLFCVGSSVLLLRAGGGRRLPGFLAVLAALLLAAAGAWFVFQESARVQARLAELTLETYRPRIFDAALRHWQEAPMWGGGPGSFEDAARRLRTFETETDDIFAHNDWLQLAAEFGYPAAALVLLLVLALLAGGISTLGGSLARRMASSAAGGSHAAAAQLAALSILGACAVHSFLDFNMQIPANALMAAASAGMLASSGVASREPRPWLARARGVLTALLALGFSIGLGLRVLRESPNEMLLLRAENAWLSGEPALAARWLDALIEREPAHAAALALRGRVRLDLGARQPETLRRTGFLAARDLEQAARLRPPSVFDEIALAMAWGRAGEAPSAQQAAARAVALFPSYHGGYEVLGLAFEALGRAEDALEIYRLGASQPSAIGFRDRFSEFSRSR